VHQGLEPPGVHGVAGQPDGVPGALPHDHGRAGARGGARFEPAAEVGDVGLQGAAGVGRRVPAPDGLDEAVGGHDLAAGEQQHGQDGALPWTAQVEGLPGARRRELTQEVDPQFGRADHPPFPARPKR
jgi:hypothetical protein